MLPEREAVYPLHNKERIVLKATLNCGNALQAASNPSEFVYLSIVLTIVIFQLTVEI